MQFMLGTEFTPDHLRAWISAFSQFLIIQFSYIPPLPMAVIKAPQTEIDFRLIKNKLKLSSSSITTS
jgi:hypothetical protein